MLVGRDTRASGRELEHAFASGVASAGGHAVLAGMEVEEEIDERALERGPSALVDREAGTRDLGTGCEVEHAERLGDLPVRPLALGRIEHAEIAVMVGRSQPYHDLRVGRCHV